MASRFEELVWRYCCRLSGVSAFCSCFAVDTQLRFLQDVVNSESPDVTNLELTSCTAH